MRQVSRANSLVLEVCLTLLEEGNGVVLVLILTLNKTAHGPLRKILEMTGNPTSTISL
jgi:hypothetical protein